MRLPNGTQVPTVMGIHDDVPTQLFCLEGAVVYDFVGFKVLVTPRGCSLIRGSEVQRTDFTPPGDGGDGVERELRELEIQYGLA